jgi:hypothetical protein
MTRTVTATNGNHNHDPILLSGMRFAFNRSRRMKQPWAGSGTGQFSQFLRDASEFRRKRAASFLKEYRHDTAISDNRSGRKTFSWDMSQAGRHPIKSWIRGPAVWGNDARWGISPERRLKLRCPELMKAGLYPSGQPCLQNFRCPFLAANDRAAHNSLKGRHHARRKRF